MPAKRLDAHLHVWASKEEAESGKYPFAGAMLGGKSDSSEPPMPGHVEVLLDQMKQAQVAGALIIQPGNHKFDHSYVSAVLASHRSKFVGALLADPTSDNGVDELTRLVQEEGFEAVRFNPYLWPEGQRMTDQRGKAMYKRAGELGAPVGHMPFKGLLLHIDEIRELASEFPDTKVIIDHFGFCKASDTGTEEWQALLGLAAFPQVHVKTSAFFRISDKDYPYQDAHACVRKLIDTFGADRVMYGSDFPWVTEQCGYVKAWDVLPEDVLSSEEAQWVMSGTLEQLFPRLKQAEV